MRELGRGATGSLEDQDVLVSIREMVLAADDVADAEIDVVGAGGEVVGGHAVGTEEREVFDVVGGFDVLAVDRVREADLLAGAAGNAEAEGEGLSGGGSAVALGAGSSRMPGLKSQV